MHPLDSTIVLILIKKSGARQHYIANPEEKHACSRQHYSTNPEKKRACSRQHYIANPEKRCTYSRQQYSANPARKKAAAHAYLALNHYNMCAQRGAKYVLAAPEPDVKDMYVKEIQSQLLADAEGRSQLSYSFPKKHINAKNKVSGIAMCRVLAKKLLNKALQICRKHAGSLHQAARLVQTMELTDKNDFGEVCRMGDAS